MTGAIVRQHAICVHDISSDGALFECRAQLPPGAVGLLQVVVEGRARVEVFRVSRTLTVPGSGGWRIGVEFLPIMPAGDRSLRAAVAGFDTAAGSPPHVDGLKSGAPMTSDDAAARRQRRHVETNRDFTRFPHDLTTEPPDAVTGSPVAHADDQPVTPRRNAPIEEDR
jgi:hypothetical protein